LIAKIPLSNDGVTQYVTSLGRFGPAVWQSYISHGCNDTACSIIPSLVNYSTLPSAYHIAQCRADEEDMRHQVPTIQQSMPTSLLCLMRTPTECWPAVRFRPVKFPEQHQRGPLLQLSPTARRQNSGTASVSDDRLSPQQVSMRLETDSRLLEVAHAHLHFVQES
jgi:hypothetical protein